MANCCDNNTCEELVTYGYLKKLSSDAFAIPIGKKEGDAPKYSDFSGTTSVIPKRSTDAQNADNDVDGFTYPSSLSLIDSKCSVNASELALYKAQIGYEWTTKKAEPNGGKTATYCDLTYVQDTKTTWTRNRRSCNGGDDINETVVETITANTSDSGEWTRTVTTSKTNTHMDFEVSFQNGSGLNTYKYGFDVTCPSSIGCEGGTCTVKISGSSHCASDLSVAVASSNIENYNGETFTTSDSDATLNKTITITVPKNDGDKTSGSFTVTPTVWGTTYGAMTFTFNRGICTPLGTKATWVNTDGSIHSIDCNYSESDTISQGEVSGHSGTMQTLTVGECADAIGRMAFNGFTELSSVELPNDFLNIGPYSFDECPKLADITIPNTVTTIGQYAFESCTSLTSFHIPTSLSTISDGMLRECDALSEIVIPSNVRTIGLGAFYSCDNLTSVTFENGVTSIGGAAFRYCANLENVVLPQTLQRIESSAFNSCHKLTHVEIPTSVTYIDDDAFNHTNAISDIIFHSPTPPTLNDPFNRTFNNCQLYVPCEYLEAYQNAWPQWKEAMMPLEEECNAKLIFERYNVSGVTLCDTTSGVTMDDYPTPSSALTSIKIGNCAKTIQPSAFENCQALSEVIIPSQIESIGNNAFKNTSRYTFTVTMEGLEPPILGNEVFEQDEGRVVFIIKVHCEALEAYKTAPNWSNYADRIRSIEEGCTSNVKYTYTLTDGTVVKGTLCDDTKTLNSDDTKIITDRTMIKSLQIHDCVTSIGDAAFSNCLEMNNVILPNSLTTIGDSVFVGNPKLLNITIPSGVTTMGEYVFYQGSIDPITISMEPLTPPSISPNTFIGRNCSIKVHCDVLSDYKTAEYWVNYADRIEPIEDDCLKMEYYIMNETKSIICNGNATLTRGEIPTEDDITVIQGVTIGSCVETIGTSLLNMGDAHSSLQIIEMKDGVKTIGQYAFLGTNSLRSITWPNTLEEIQYEAFFSSGIHEVILPNGLKRLGGAVFQLCESLTALTIPSTIEQIGPYLCDGCSALTSVTIERQTPPQLAEYAFDGSYPIYVPCEGIVAYKQADGWKEYCERIMPIEQDCTYDYECPSFKLSYIIQGDDNPKIIACDGNTTLYSTDIGETALNNIYSVIIGECTKVIGGSCFFSATTLGTLGFQEGCVEIANNAFAYCSYLINFAFPNSLTTIGNSAFGTCRHLTEVTIPSGVTSIGNSAFHQCSNLRRIDVEATTPPMLGANAFGETNNCPIYVPCAAINAYKQADGWKEYCERIQTKWDECNKAEWFDDNGEEGAIPCDSSLTLSYEDFPHDERPMTHMTIGGCAETINEDTLRGLLTVKTLELKEGVKTIQTNAIAGCRNLKQITLPSSITTIGYNALYGCTSLEWIKIYATTPPTISGTAFSDTNNCPIYVPTTAVNAYKTALGSEYTDRIQPMP